MDGWMGARREEGREGCKEGGREGGREEKWMGGMDGGREGGRCAGALFQSPACWTILPCNIVIGESKATRTGLHDPPLYLEKRNCASTRFVRGDASCIHSRGSTELQDTFIHDC